MSTFARTLAKNARQVCRSQLYQNKTVPCTQIRLISTDKTKSSSTKPTEDVKVDDVIVDKVGSYFNFKIIIFQNLYISV